MKKLVLIASIAMCLLCKANAQTIVSGKSCVNLTNADVSYIMRNGTPSMIEALKSTQTIRNSDVGDNIIRLLNNRRNFTLVAKR